MKCSSIVLLATGALAAQPIYREATLVERQSISTVESDIAAISSAAAALDSSIGSFSGLSDSAALISSSEAVVTAIKKATSDANALSTISINDATGLITPIQSLSDEVKTAVNALIAKKSTFAALSLCGEVLSQVQAQQTAASAFSTALISKVPSELQSTAQGLSAPIISELSTAANSFMSCPAGSSSSSPSTSTTPSTSTATSPSTSSATTTSAPGSIMSTSTCTTSTTMVSVPAPYSTGVVPAPYSTGSAPAPYNGTSPSVPATPTVSIIPSNSGNKQAAGFGGLILAAVAALAAF